MCQTKRTARVDLSNRQSETSVTCRDATHNESITLTLLGGDARQFAVSASLAAAGYRVNLMGLGEAEDGHLTSQGPLPSMEEGIRVYHRLDRALEGCAGIILPYPATKDGQTVFCPLDTQHTILLSDIEAFAAKHPAVTVFGGRLPKAMTEALSRQGCHVVDYEQDEAFLIRNARLTAEGAVMMAMELTDTALLNAPVAVIGYGRIGRLLAHLLSSLGAEVTVFARRSESLAEAEALGYRTAHTSDMGLLTTGYRVIFNTVPVILVGKEILAKLPCNTLVVELASAPGGLDPEGITEATGRCGLQVVRAPSLPGRYAPKDAGLAIADCILSALGEVKV